MRSANILARPVLLNFLNSPSDLCDAISKSEPPIEPRACHTHNSEWSHRKFPLCSPAISLTRAFARRLIGRDRDHYKQKNCTLKMQQRRVTAAGILDRGL